MKAIAVKTLYTKSSKLNEVRVMAISSSGLSTFIDDHEHVPDEDFLIVLVPQTLEQNVKIEELVNIRAATLMDLSEEDLGGERI